MPLKGRSLLLGLLALAFFALTLRLGFWQWGRAQEKLQLQAAQAERQALPVLAGEAQAPRTADDVAERLHRRLRLEGRWAPSATAYLENRPMNGRVGFLVVTPLLLDDGTAVAVQRGWTPRDAADRTRVALPPTAEGRVAIEGRIAATASRAYALGEELPGAIRQNLDLAAYTQESRLKLRPWVLVQTADPALADGLLRDWAAPDSGASKNQGYAVQWWAMAALTFILYVWFQFIQPRRRARA